MLEFWFSLALPKRRSSGRQRLALARHGLRNAPFRMLQQAHIQRHALTRLAYQADSRLRAARFAYTAAHAFLPRQDRRFLHAESSKGTGFGASAAANAEGIIQFGDETRRSNHRVVIFQHRLNPAAAAFTAVAYDIKTVQVILFEVSRMHVPTRMFCS